jgi:hypothetical protein
MNARNERRGLTYNFKKSHTDYQSSIDCHVDLEASRFLTKQFHVGAVGYTFNRLTGDSGSGATLVAYKSRISAIGPTADRRLQPSLGVRRRDDELISIKFAPG